MKNKHKFADVTMLTLFIFISIKTQLETILTIADTILVFVNISCLHRCFHPHYSTSKYELLY